MNHGWKHKLASKVSELIPFHNPRVVAPLGTLRRTKGERPFVIVASMPRTGTHLMMDGVFNNFREYCRDPLYLDLVICEWRKSFPGRHELAASRGYVVKTHFPWECSEAPLREEHARCIDTLIELGAKVVVLRRAKDRHRGALGRFLGEPVSEEHFQGSWNEFESFWGPRADLEVDFESLVDGERFDQVIRRCGEMLGLKPPEVVRRPLSPKRKELNYLNKLLTRLLAGRAPVVSTGIGFQVGRSTPS